MPTQNQFVLIRQLIEAARNNLDTATQLLRAVSGADADAPAHAPVSHHVGGTVQRTSEGAVIIEGVFDGQNMVGPDGKLYSVPANYASKSKLVEGDLLKLTISPDGSFIYKQIGPVERERVVGVLSRDEETDEFRVLAKSQLFRVLLASVTYFKADLGDEVVVLVPKGTPSSWAAVENVIKKQLAGSLLATTAPETTEPAAPPEAAAQLPAETSAPTPARRGRKPGVRTAKAEPVAVSAEPDGAVPLIEV